MSGWPAIALTLGALLAAPAQAQQTAAPASTEQQLGRLFFTPEKRRQLDRQRQLDIVEKSDAPADPALTVNGVVTRSDGRRTVWINGVAQDTRRARNGRGTADPDDAALAKARVGETIDRGTGQTTDLLGGGRIEIRRAAPAATGR